MKKLLLTSALTLGLTLLAGNVLADEPVEPTLDDPILQPFSGGPTRPPVTGPIEP
ncbi:hypothetical protein [Alkalihalobacillus pseudalcaliphilus]|uniref:hypothetical protein n=1 Tax=Alkalihalobacillus pseudalcaliphilus TaxID=79884 RepID=UPI000B1F306C|nr:hypothetical protein [Alkalihalobacillus pseudalcaliphilus]